MQTIGIQSRKSTYSGGHGGQCVEVGAVPWRKSSYSGHGGQNCVEVGRAPWRKSSYSGHGGQDCVEAGDVAGAVLIRDTKDNERGPVLRVTPSDWRRFTARLRATAHSR